MNVLSLFDGMSCGQIALQKAGIKHGNYFSSEIDRYAIQIVQKNYPNTIQLGDITKWREWNLPQIDLIIGGSPCQGFSAAGKGLNFDDPRSKLFFEFVNILEFYSPKFFLLENVKMRKWQEDIITTYLKVKPIEINSSLVSAQLRKRLYWTNIPKIVQPYNKHIMIEDILEKDAMTPVLHNLYGGFKETKPRIFYCKSPTIRTPAGGGHIPSVTLIDYDKEPPYRKLTPLECERLQTVSDGYTEGVSNTQRYKMLGNGWTVDVIAHIFSFLPEDWKV
jgi:site-specific DNA-cytosine methylase